MNRLFPFMLACVVCGGCAATNGEPQVNGPPQEAPPRDSSGMGPQNPIAAVVEAEEAEMDGEHADLVRLREAAEQNPSDPQAHRRLGVALRRARRIDEAFRHLEQAARLAPEDTDALLSLGIAYSTEHRLSEAEATYRRILEIVPDHAKALNNLGNVAVRRGDEQGAIELYGQAVEADPGYLMAMHKLADLLKYHGRHDEAYPIYERILQMQPETARERIAMVESLYGMGSINLARNEYDLAERQLAQVVRNIPNHRSAHWARAQALIQLGRDDEAQQELALHVQILHALGEGF